MERKSTGNEERKFIILPNEEKYKRLLEARAAVDEFEASRDDDPENPR